MEKDFLETFELDLSDGRDFSENDQGVIIINETAMKEFGWQRGALGKEVVQFTRGSEQRWRVIGVIKDVHFESLYNKVKPLILASGISSGSRIIVWVSPNNIAGTLDYIKKAWKPLGPEWPLDFYFLDDDINRLYLQEERLSKIVQSFTFLAIFVSCIGLLGLVSFSSEQRTKEIGIRKVLGASVSNIVLLLSKKFLMLITVALIIAIPVAYFVINKWLQNFAYRVDIASWTLLFAGGLTLLIALLTVTSQAIKVALANPVETLRRE